MEFLKLSNVEELVIPISDDQPVGCDPREDISPLSRYYTLKDIRSQARANERILMVDDDAMQSLAVNWQPILDQIPIALKTECKDLEFVAWLIEALCRVHGFKGLAFGFSLANKLIDLYWDLLYPLPDEEGLETRIAPIIGLNGTDGEGALITPIFSIPIAEYGSEITYATWQYIRATEIARLDNEKQRLKSDSGIASLTDIEEVVNQSSADYYLSLIADIEVCISEFTRLSNTMDRVMKGVPQPTSMISKALDKCLKSVSFLSADLINNHVVKHETLCDKSTDNCNKFNPAPGTDFSEQSYSSEREAVIAKLRDTASFFRKNEPHSPISYLIDQAIRWSDMPLPELLKELIDDTGTRNSYFRLTGIPVSE